MRADRTESEFIDRIQPGRLGICELTGLLLGVGLGAAQAVSSAVMGASAKRDIASGTRAQKAAMRRALIQREQGRQQETTQRVGAGLGRVAGGGLDATAGAGGTAGQVRVGEAIAESRDIAQLRANFATGIAELNARASIAQNQATAGIVSGVFGGASTALSAFGTFKGLKAMGAH